MKTVRLSTPKSVESSYKSVLTIKMVSFGEDEHQLEMNHLDFLRLLECVNDIADLTTNTARKHIGQITESLKRDAEQHPHMTSGLMSALSWLNETILTIKSTRYFLEPLSEVLSDHDRNINKEYEY